MQKRIGRKLLSSWLFCSVLIFGAMGWCACGGSVPTETEDESSALSPVTVPTAVAGLKLAYFADYKGSSAQDLLSLTPTEEMVAPDFKIDLSAIGDYKGYVFSGYIKASKKGTYQFTLNSDEGSILAVGSKTNIIVNNDGLHGMTSKSGSVYLKSGYHAIYLAYFEQTGAQGLEVRWKKPGSSRVLIPASVLFHDGTVTPPVPGPTPPPTPGDWWKPVPGTSWQWQISGTVDTSFNVQMYDIDLFESSQALIDQLHAKGTAVICYFSAGSKESGRPDSNDFPAMAIGSRMDGWPENWIDTRNATVREIMKKRMDLAKSKKCDGVEPDNVDGYANSNGLGLTAATQLDYNKFLATEAHARGLSVGLKNDIEQAEQLVDYFDWTLNEECFAYSECDSLTIFIQKGKAVFNTEYGSASLAKTVCPKAIALNFDTLIKNLDLDAWRISCR